MDPSESGVGGTPSGVVALGECMVGLMAEPGRPLAHADRFEIMPAGTEANVAVGLARVGHRSRFVSRVGDDAFGHRIVRTLRGEGVDVSHVTLDPDRPTGLLVRDSVIDRPIDVVYHRSNSAARALGAADVPDDVFAGMSIAHTTGLTAMLSDSCHDAARHLLERARTLGLTTSLDVNVRHKVAPIDEWPARLYPLLGLVDVVFVGEDELEAVVPQRASLDDAVRLLHDAGPSIIVVKRGAEGALVSSATGVISRPAVATRVVDPVGAGDGFVAGFFTAVLDGDRADDLDLALRTGLAAAAAVVSTVGDQLGLPDRRALDAILADDTGTQR